MNKKGIASGSEVEAVFLPAVGAFGHGCRARRVPTALRTGLAGLYMSVVRYRLLSSDQLGTLRLTAFFEREYLTSRLIQDGVCPGPYGSQPCSILLISFVGCCPPVAFRYTLLVQWYLDLGDHSACPSSLAGSVCLPLVSVT